MKRNRGFRWENEGMVIFKVKCFISDNNYINVRKDGVLIIGDQFHTNQNVTIIVEKK